MSVRKPVTISPSHITSYVSIYVVGLIYRHMYDINDFIIIEHILNILFQYIMFRKTDLTKHCKLRNHYNNTAYV